MTLNNLAYLFVLSFIAILILFFLNVPVFHECYLPLSVRMGLGVSLLPPMSLENCLFAAAAFLFLLLTLIPIALTLMVQAIFYLFRYDRRLIQYIFWAIWLVCIFYASQFHFITSDYNTQI